MMSDMELIKGITFKKYIDGSTAVGIKDIVK